MSSRLLHNKRNYQPCTALCGRKWKIPMTCTEAYKGHIMYTFNGFCKVVIRYAAINAWWERSRRRQRENFLDYLIERFSELEQLRRCGHGKVITTDV